MAPAMSVIEQQDSRLLKLPAELRLRIYEIVLDNTNFATVDTSSGKPEFSIRGHSLAAVCRQITHEFAPLFIKIAPSHCTVLVHRSKNFELPALKDIVDFFNPLPTSPVRTYIQSVFIDDDWEQNFSYNIKKFIWGSVSVEHGGVLAILDVRFDPKTFDPTPFLRVLNKDDWCSRSRVSIVEEALKSAMKRYAGEDAEEED